MHATDGVDFLDAQLGEKTRRRGAQGLVVTLVGGDDDGLPALVEVVGNLLVLDGDAVLDVDHPDKHGGLLDDFGDLLTDEAVKDVGSVFAMMHPQPARIDEQELLAEVLGGGGDAVARHAALLMHDGDPLAEDAVEEGGLAHIRATDYGDDGE